MLRRPHRLVFPEDRLQLDRLAEFTLKPLDDAFGHDAFFADVAGGGDKDAQDVWGHVIATFGLKELATGSIIRGNESYAMKS